MWPCVPNLTLPAKGSRLKKLERIWSRRLPCSSRLQMPPKSIGGFTTKSSSRRSRYRLRRLRVLSGSEVCRILEGQGFVAVRQRGSHRVMQKRLEGTTISVPVPLHDPVLRGTLLSIVRQSGLPRALFEGQD